MGGRPWFFASAAPGGGGGVHLAMTEPGAGTRIGQVGPRAARGGSVSLPVLGAGKAERRIRKSRNARRRAAVLILVHVIIAAHIVLWMVTGMRTLTPVEPSEAMYTLEQGLVNAGFVFFALALVSTLVLGRFFCGWGCHVVALQDLCAWMMKRLGVHPKPFRSRLLIYMPLLLALYMFVWPTLRREVLQPLAGERWAQLAPYLGETPPRPQLQTHFTTTDFWATFPPWYIAIPFLAVCGFGVVYFLGSKGFCTYGCPYGGLFAPADRVSPGRIVVNDNCEHCGHCTAVCSSNVRVHEEVRDYGMVVDSGCMKCMDCVSVCPNQALSFGFARPSLLARARTVNPAPRFGRRTYDLHRGEEIAAGAVFIGLTFLAYRGMFDSVPLLMAVGMAAIGTFVLWKTWRLLREPSVRLQNLQLKYKGAWRPAGFVVAATGALVLASGMWGALVRYHLIRADALDAQVTVPMQVVYGASYQPDPRQRGAALAGVRHLDRTASVREGGIGWGHTLERQTRLAWLLSAAGEDGRAERELRRALQRAADSREGPSQDMISALFVLMARRGAPAEGAAGELRQILALRPDLAEVRLRLAGVELQRGEYEAAAREAQLAGESRANDAGLLASVAEILIQSGQTHLAAENLRRAAALQGGTAQGHVHAALAWMLSAEHESALAELERAAELEPENPNHARMIAEILLVLGRDEEATRWLRRANRSSTIAPDR
jgi:Flp pilus assembly protein TadD/NAD-dependent dihydropyrimidine dehydrogenase PreA subunit